MLVKITIETDKGKVERKFEWEVDGDYQNKGEVVEDMLDTLEESINEKF